MNNANIRNHYDAFLRIHTFGLKYAEQFPSTGRGGGLFAEMAAVVPELERLGVGQFTGATGYHSGVSAKLDAAEQLRDHLRRIRQTAKAIATADHNPRFPDPFHLPKSRAMAALMTQGKAVLDAATPLAARFIDFEMPTDFIAELTADLARLTNAVGDQDTGMLSQIGGTAGMIATVDRGIDVRAQLIPVVINKLKNSHSALAEWESAVRIVRPVRERRGVKKAEVISE